MLTLNMLEEAKKRDHRRLGKELGLFMLTEEGPGFPFFLPNGMVPQEHPDRLLARSAQALWLCRGFHPDHSQPQAVGAFGPLDHYKNNMYTTVIDDEDFAIKPMNCPGGMLVYKSQPHSYRELPLARGRAGHRTPP